MLIEPVLLILTCGVTFVVGGACALAVSDGALRARERRLADRQRALQARCGPAVPPLRVGADRGLLGRVSQ